MNGGAQIAIVGSGPSGFYAAEALLRADPQIAVDMFERLPTPFGLVRGGVAPDHPKIKQVSLVYDRIAKASQFRFFGNVQVGADLPVDALLECYHAVVFANGASFDRRLGVPGEDLPGCVAATDFVGWYNGHPDCSRLEFDLSHETAVIIGQGNVAADIARMLASPAQALASTDITEVAARALARSRVRDIYIVGRRGPAQAKFTSNELRELGEIPDCDPVVDSADLELNEASARELADPRGEENAKNVALFREFAVRARSGSRRCHFRFLESPVAIEGGARVESIVLSHNRLEGEPFSQAAAPTGEVSRLACGLIFKCAGFRGAPLAGIPFDDARGIIPNAHGRVIAEGKPIPGLYVAGWMKRGASGTIGTNRADSVETVKALLEDVGVLRARRPAGSARIEQILQERSIRAVDYKHWLKLDALEVERGRARGKPREKITEVASMLDIV